MTKEELKLVLKTLEQYQVKRQDFERFADVITDIKKTLAQPKEQEPVAWISQKSGFISPNKPDPSFDPLPLYTTPPQRTWVRLTDEEIYKIYTKEGWNGLIFAHAIESKLKAKNTRDKNDY